MGDFKWGEGDRLHPVPEEALAGTVWWGERDHNHPAPEDASGVAMRKQGVRGTTPEFVGAAQGLGLRLAQGVRIGLPRAAPQGMGGGDGRFRPKVDLSGLFKPREGGLPHPSSPCGRAWARRPSSGGRGATTTPCPARESRWEQHMASACGRPQGRVQALSRAAF